MSEIRVDEITDEAGTGAPSFPNGINAADLTGTLPALDGSALTGVASGAGSAEAFVSFVGTGTVSVRGSGNVSSVTDNGTGNYTANFSNSLSSANFSATMGGGRLNSTSGTSGWQKTWSHATGSIRAMTHNGTSTATDHELIEITATI